MDAALEDPLIILETVSEAYVRLDSDFRFSFVNRAALSGLRKMPAELLEARNCGMYIHPVSALLST